MLTGGSRSHGSECSLTAVLFVTVLILINGVFALSELALASSRKSRLKALEDAERPGARAALALVEDPSRFLSTVQIGITLIGIVAGAVSGAALSQQLDAELEAWGIPTPVAEPLAYTFVIGAITYFSVVIGELVPKNLALRNAEGFACALAPTMLFLSRVAAPAVWVLDASTRVIFRIMGQGAASQSAVTEEEIKLLVTEAANAGVIEVEERAMIGGILRLGDRSVSGVMTPRVDVDLLDISVDETNLIATLTSTTHSRLPVHDGDPDSLIGVVHVRELLANALAGKRLDVRAALRQAPFIPDTLSAIDALEQLRQAEVPMALVHDEYGHFDGIVTPADILDAIAGAFRSDEGDQDPDAVQREDGSWLLAGSMPADEMADKIGLKLPEVRDYDTVAGFVISLFERLPSTGEAETFGAWRFEVVDLDGRRIDKVLATRLRG